MLGADRPCPSPRNPTAAPRDSGDDRPGRPAPTPGCAGLAKDQVDQQGVGGKPLQVGLDGRLLAPPQPILQLQRQQLAEQGALLQCGGGDLGQAFLQRRRCARIARPPRTARTPGRSAAGSPRKGRDRSADRAPAGCFRDHDLPLFFKSRWPAPKPAGSTPAAARRCAGRSPAAGQSRRWCSRRVSTGRFAGRRLQLFQQPPQFSATMAANSGSGLAAQRRLETVGLRQRGTAGQPPPRFCRRSYLIRSCALWAVSTTSRGQRLSRSASCGKRPPAAPKHRLLKARQRHVLFIGEAAGAGAKLVPRQADQAGEVGLPELPGSRRLTPL